MHKGRGGMSNHKHGISGHRYTKGELIRTEIDKETKKRDGVKKKQKGKIFDSIKELMAHEKKK